MPPIDRLPNSILSDIFILTCYVGSHECCAYGRVPYTLASVCRLWRMVALSTSRLWNFIDAVLSPECVSAHLARSGVLPLDISLDTSSSYKGHIFCPPRHVDADALEESLDLLHDNWARIRHLDVRLIAGEHQHLVVDTLNNAINICDNDSLLSIFVHAKLFEENGWVLRPMDSGIQLFLPHSDTLRRIELNSIDLRLTPRPYTRPLIGLRELDLCSPSTIDFFNTLFPLLELLPNLSHLSLKGHTLTDSWSAPPRHSISLPMLEMLRLTNIRGWTSLNYVLQTLDVPKLRSLYHLTDSDLDEGLIAMIRRCKLEVIVGPGATVMDAVVSSADSLGSLKRLLMFPGRRSERPLSDLVVRLARRLCEVDFCPMLEYLRGLDPPDVESIKAVDKLRSARPSLKIRAGSN